MSKFKVEVLPLEKVLLGEGPHWDAQKQELYYVDLMGREVWSYSPQTGKSSNLKIDSDCLGEPAVSLIIPVKGSQSEFIIGHGRSLKRLFWNEGSERLTTLYDAEDNNLEGRFNDGKCDSAGRLWTGTMASYKSNPSAEDLTKGSLYSLDTNGTVTKHVGDLGVSNGLTWSPDDTNFYFIDSYTRRVDTFDYNAGTGSISNRRIAFDFKEEDESGIPDGMTIDIDGNLWVACFSASKVIKVDPRKGKVLARVDLPTSFITSVTFGGPDLDVLYVTSSKFGMTEEQLRTEPLAGSLFKVTQVGTKGISAGIPYGK